LGEYFKQALLRFTVENFREDLRKMLGLSLAHIKLKRDPGLRGVPEGEEEEEESG